MIRDFIYSLFSFVILDPFPDKRYRIEVVFNTYQIKPGCIPVRREDAYRLQSAKLLHEALVFHKVGDMARLQTDTIIIGAFINVTTVSFVGHYNYVISSVSNFVNIIFNSVLSSFGNLIATENKEKQYKMFRVYRFAACWIYGFSAIGFYLMLTPLITLWLGQATPSPISSSAVL